MEEIVADMSKVSVNPDKTVGVDQAGEPRTAEDSAPTEAPAPTEDQLSKGSGDFTPEERATIIAMAKEVGFAKVANEFGIKARLISYWVQQEKKRAARPTKPSRPSTSPKPKAKVKGRSSSRTLVKEVVRPEHIEGAPSVAAVPVKAIEPAERKAERTVSAKPTGSAQSAERSEALTDRQSLIDKQGLIIENAILKERILALNAEIEKLRAALTSLM